jgi:hypothetical protein
MPVEPKSGSPATGSPNWNTSNVTACAVASSDTYSTRPNRSSTTLPQSNSNNALPNSWIQLTWTNAEETQRLG